MISAVICVYINDSPKAFESALMSISDQSFLPSEVVLVQDGPITEDLKNIIKNYENILSKKKINFVKFAFDVNVGHGLARRKAIEMCNNDIIAISDADDLNEETRFNKQYTFLARNKDISIVGGYVKEIVDGKWEQVRKVKESHKDIVNYCKFRCPMNQMTVMFRKSAVMAVGGYKDFYHNEDYYLWIRLILKGFRFSNIPEVLVTANVDSNSYKRRAGIRYFISETKIQMIMLKHKITTLPNCAMSIIIRVFVQLLMPNYFRKLLFLKCFRS